MTEQMKVHPVAAMFPLLQGAEFEQLKVSIQAEGLLQPIEVQTDPLTDERVLIDGRNRLRACEELGVEPRFEEYTGSEDSIAAHIVARNVARRHLTSSQLSGIAALVSEWYEEQAKKRQTAAAERTNAVRWAADESLSPNLGEAIPTATLDGIIATSDGVVISTADPPYAPGQRATMAAQSSGRTAELIARDFNVGRGSVESALAIKKQDPALLNKVIAGEIKVSTAYNQMRGKTAASQSERRVEQPEEELVGLIMMLSPDQVEDVIGYVKKLLGRAHDR